MCNYCYEHTRKVWYLQKESFDIRARKFLKIFPGRFREWFFDFLAYILDDFVDESTADVNVSLEERKPYTGLKRWLYNYFAKNILGGQVTTSLDEALRVIDKADEFFLTYCSCKKGAGEGEDYRCIFVNHNAKVQRKLSAKGRGRFIDRDEAKEIVIDHRREGHFNTVMWGIRPKVDSICNCDHYCAGLRIPEIQWGLLPSLRITQVKNRDNCDPDCDICLQTCHANAIIKEKRRRVLQINQQKCIGCHLCIENCPYDVFESIPRRVYYDATIGKKVKWRNM